MIVGKHEFRKLKKVPTPVDLLRTAIKIEEENIDKISREANQRIKESEARLIEYHKQLSELQGNKDFFIVG